MACNKTVPTIPPENYQLLYGTSFLPCTLDVRMDFYGPIQFKITARKGHAKRKAPPPGIKRIVQEALGNFKFTFNHIQFYLAERQEQI